MIDTTTDMSFGSDDFTAECWVYPTNIANTDGIMGQWSAQEGYNWFLTFSGSGTNNGLRFGYNGGNFSTSSSTGINYNTWTHIAVVRDGTTLRYFINGTTAGTASIGATSINTGCGFKMPGAEYPSANSYDFIPTMYVDEVRISNTARYTSGFTPSTTAFENDSNTLLLLHAEQVDADTTVIFDDNGGTLPTYTPPVTSDYSLQLRGGDYGYIDAGPFTSTSQIYSFFCWFYVDSDLSVNRFITESFRNGISAFRLELYQSKLMVNGFNSANSPLYRAQHNTNLSEDTWYAVWASVDPSNTNNRSFAYQEYGSNTVINVTSSNSNFFANITGVWQSGFYDETRDIGIGARGANGAVAIRGNIAEFWIDDVFRDFTSSTNREKFVDSSGYPVDLGSDGSTPFGSAPPIYIAGDTMLTTNRGDSGDNPVYNGGPPLGSAVGTV